MSGEELLPVFDYQGVADSIRRRLEGDHAAKMFFEALGDWKDSDYFTMVEDVSGYMADDLFLVAADKSEWTIKAPEAAVGVVTSM